MSRDRQDVGQRGPRLHPAERGAGVAGRGKDMPVFRIIGHCRNEMGKPFHHRFGKSRLDCQTEGVGPFLGEANGQFVGLGPVHFIENLRRLAGQIEPWLFRQPQQQIAQGRIGENARVQGDPVIGPHDGSPV